MPPIEPIWEDTLDRRDNVVTNQNTTSVSAPPHHPLWSQQQQAVVRALGQYRQVSVRPSQPGQPNAANDVGGAQGEANRAEPGDIPATGTIRHDPHRTFSVPHSQNGAGNNQNQYNSNQGGALDKAAEGQQGTGINYGNIGTELDDSFMDEFVKWEPYVDHGTGTVPSDVDHAYEQLARAMALW
ncbi:hypothetical protein AYO22_03084 [Fonsecaea multimorphosa]|nr:hypothetical protein AYO22_03084 [Fonsecaea multimorphosa]